VAVGVKRSFQLPNEPVYIRAVMKSLLTKMAVVTGVVLLGVVSWAQQPPPVPKLTFAFEVRASVGAPLEVGNVAQGRRRIVPITGGTFEGSGLRGKVMPGGADWQIIRADGFTELDTRYTLETATGQVVYVQNAGMRHAAPDVMKRTCEISANLTTGQAKTVITCGNLTANYGAGLGELLNAKTARAPTRLQAHHGRPNRRGAEATRGRIRCAADSIGGERG